MQNKKPTISWYKNYDPTSDNSWQDKLTEVNIINTKKFTSDFVQFCLNNKHRIFLHCYISGMGQTAFEPNIPSVKHTIEHIKMLVDNGFPQRQILIVISPIVSNDNGLKALKLMLRLFTEFRELRLRWMRFELLQYQSVGQLQPKFKAHQTAFKNKDMFDGKYVLKNPNILMRSLELRKVRQYLFKQDSFYREYYGILDKYRTIINIDAGDEYHIGVRELQAFGYTNQWINPDGTKEKLINYENNNRFKPILNIISKNGEKTIRCKNKCVLCPHLY